MKKTGMTVLIALAVLIFVGFGVGVLAVLSLPQGAVTETTLPTQELGEFLQEQWADFPVESYDEQNGVLVCGHSVGVSYDNAVSFGADSYEDVALGHIGTMQAIAATCETWNGTTLTSITIHGYSSDGKLIYTVGSDGSLWACWQ